MSYTAAVWVECDGCQRTLGPSTLRDARIERKKAGWLEVKWLNAKRRREVRHFCDVCATLPLPAGIPKPGGVCIYR